MQFIGDRKSKIEAKRSEKLERPMRVKPNITLEDVKKEEFFAAGDKKDGLVFDYKFDVQYGETSGNINVEGSIFAVGDKKELTSTIKDWKKNKSIKPEITVAVLNKAMEIALLTAIPVSKELGLPVPLQLPRFKQEEKKKEEEQSYVG